MKCGEFIGELFRARDILHIQHLQSKNMDEHVILEELYDEILEEVDEIAELRLARGPAPIKIRSSSGRIDAVDFLEDEFVPMLDDMKEMADEKGFNDIGAEVDELKVASMRALYKLKNLAGSGKRKEYEKESSDSGITEYKHSGGVLYSPIQKSDKKPLLTKK